MFDHIRQFRSVVTGAFKYGNFEEAIIRWRQNSQACREKVKRAIPEWRISQGGKIIDDLQGPSHPIRCHKNKQELGRPALTMSSRKDRNGTQAGRSQGALA
jgi:hypothetical protein